MDPLAVHVKQARHRLPPGFTERRLPALSGVKRFFVGLAGVLVAGPVAQAATFATDAAGRFMMTMDPIGKHDTWWKEFGLIRKATEGVDLPQQAHVVVNHHFASAMQATWKAIPKMKHAVGDLHAGQSVDLSSLNLPQIVKDRLMHANGADVHSGLTALTPPSVPGPPNIVHTVPQGFEFIRQTIAHWSGAHAWDIAAGAVVLVAVALAVYSLYRHFKNRRNARQEAEVLDLQKATQSVERLRRHSGGRLSSADSLEFLDETERLLTALEANRSFMPAADALIPEARILWRSFLYNEADSLFLRMNSAKTPDELDGLRSEVNRFSESAEGHRDWSTAYDQFHLAHVNSEFQARRVLLEKQAAAEHPAVVGVSALAAAAQPQKPGELLADWERALAGAQSLRTEGILALAAQYRKLVAPLEPSRSQSTEAQAVYRRIKGDLMALVWHRLLDMETQLIETPGHSLSEEQKRTAWAFIGLGPNEFKEYAPVWATAKRLIFHKESEVYLIEQLYAGRRGVIENLSGTGSAMQAEAHRQLHLFERRVAAIPARKKRDKAKAIIALNVLQNVYMHVDFDHAQVLVLPRVAAALAIAARTSEPEAARILWRMPLRWFDSLMAFTRRSPTSTPMITPHGLVIGLVLALPALLIKAFLNRHTARKLRNLDATAA